MNLKIEDYKKTMLVGLGGELDHHTSLETRKKIDDYFHSQNMLNIILNLEKISFMDSSGIGLIMGRYQNVKAVGGKLIVVSSNKYVDRILRMSGLLQIVEYYPSIDQAKDSIDGGEINE